MKLYVGKTIKKNQMKCDKNKLFIEKSLYIIYVLSYTHIVKNILKILSRWNYNNYIC